MRAVSTRHTVLLACVLGAGLAVGAVAWVRLWQVTPKSDPVRYWMAEGARAYSRMDSAPFSDGESIRALLAGAPVEDADGVLARRPDVIEAIRHTAFEFLSARFNARTPSEYLDWLQSRGYRFKTADEFERDYGPWKPVAALVRMERYDARAIFEGLWAYGPLRAARPDGLCIGHAAAVITIGRTSRNRFMTHVPAGHLGTDLWVGGVSGACRLWMRPPVTREAVVQSFGQAPAAQVGVIACVPRSARRPIIVSLFLDPRTSRWWIDGVSVQNFLGTEDVSSGVEY